MVLKVNQFAPCMEEQLARALLRVERVMRCDAQPAGKRALMPVLEQGRTLHIWLLRKHIKASAQAAVLQRIDQGIGIAEQLAARRIHKQRPRLHGSDERGVDEA